MSLPFFVSNILRHGLFLGLALCLYTTLMWLTRLDGPYLAIGQYFDIAISVVPIGVIIAAIRRQRQQQPLTVGQRVAIGVGVGSVAELLYRPYLYLYHTYINPAWFSYVLATKRAELMAAGQSTGAAAKELARMQAAQAQQTGMFHGFWVSALLLPALIALLTLLFVRNQPVANEQAA